MIRRANRFLPLLFLILVGGLVYVSGFYEKLNLASLSEHEAILRQTVTGHPWASLGVFVVVYAVGVAVCLPVGLILTLAGGYLFGLWTGAGASAVGATLGATMTYFAARSALGETLRQRAERSGGALKKLIDGFGRDAFSYILTIRLIPMFPFGPVNIAAGIVDAPAAPFVLATVIGEIPTCLIYAGIGAGLGKSIAQGAEPSLALILQPHILLPLIGLALLALAPMGFSRWRRRTERRDALKQD